MTDQPYTHKHTSHVMVTGWPSEVTGMTFTVSYEVHEELSVGHYRMVTAFNDYAIAQAFVIATQANWLRRAEWTTTAVGQAPKLVILGRVKSGAAFTPKHAEAVANSLSHSLTHNTFMSDVDENDEPPPVVCKCGFRVNTEHGDTLEAHRERMATFGEAAIMKCLVGPPPPEDKIESTKDDAPEVRGKDRRDRTYDAPFDVDEDENPSGE